MPDSKEKYWRDQGVKGLNEVWSHKRSTLWCVDGVFISFFLLAPYDTYRTTKESVIRAFWVQASMEGQTQKLGVPMLINTTLHQDQFLTQDLLNELVWYMYYCFNPLTPTAWFTQAMQTQMQKCKDLYMWATPMQTTMQTQLSLQGMKTLHFLTISPPESHSKVTRRKDIITYW